MAFIDWASVLSTGVTEFDDQHKQLIAYANEMDDAMRMGKGKEVLGRILTDLISYTATHFAAEEKLMVQHNYPDLVAHQAEHRALVAKVTVMVRDFNSGKADMAFAVVKLLKDWLIKHIHGTDKKYGPFFNGAGIS